MSMRSTNFGYKDLLKIHILFIYISKYKNRNYEYNNSNSSKTSIIIT